MYLIHHGVKGQKWGVKNGPPYPLTKTTINKNPKNNEEIYQTLSKNDKEKVMGGDAPKKYFKEDDFNYLARSFVTKYRNVPVSVVDLWSENDNDVAISLLTRSDFHGKGYASKTTKTAVEYLIKSNYSKAYWDVRKDNYASIALAKKNGFELDDAGETWDQYILNLNKARKKN